MTEIEKKAEEYTEKNTRGISLPIYAIESIYKAYKDGYEQGQKDFDTEVTKLLNSYGVTFIDTNSIGGLIALHQLILDMEKENEELKAQIEKIKNCYNCKHHETGCITDSYYKLCDSWTN